MTSFKDRFKDKTVVVGRDGANALLPGNTNTNNTILPLPQRGSSLMPPHQQQQQSTPNPPMRSTITPIALGSQPGTTSSNSMFSLKPGAAVSAHLHQQEQLQQHQQQQPQQQQRVQLPPISASLATTGPAPRSAPAQSRSSMNMGANSGSSSSGNNPLSNSRSSSASNKLSVAVAAPPPPHTVSAAAPAVSSENGSLADRNPFGHGGTAVSLFGGGGGPGRSSSGGSNYQPISLFGGTAVSDLLLDSSPGDVSPPKRPSAMPTLPKPLRELNYGDEDEDDDEDHELHRRAYAISHAAPAHSQQQHRQQPRAHQNQIVGMQTSVAPRPLMQVENFVATATPSPHPTALLPPVPAAAPFFGAAGQRGVPAPPPFNSLSPPHANNHQSIWHTSEPSSVASTPVGRSPQSNRVSAAANKKNVKRIILNPQQIQHRHTHNAKNGRRSTSSTGKNNQRHDVEEKQARKEEEEEDEEKSELSAAVEYKPYTLEDFRKLREQDVATINKPRGRGLGPNDSDEVRKARELRNRGKEYGESNNKINITVLPFQQRVKDAPAPTVTVDVAEAKERREKAREFARHVPKPKLRDVSNLLNNNNSNNNNNSGNNSNFGGGQCNNNSPTSTHGMSPKQLQNLARRDKLMELEAQHERDMQLVAALKSQLKL